MTDRDRIDLDRIRRALTGAPAGPERVAAVLALDRIARRLAELTGRDEPTARHELPVGR